MSALFGAQSSSSLANTGSTLFSLGQTSRTTAQPYLTASSGTKPNSSQPEWFQNPKKRVIPNHLVPKKKAGFQISTSASKKDLKSRVLGHSNLFNLVSFGANSTNSSSNVNNSIHDITGATSGDVSKYDETLYDSVNYDESLLLQDDLPPNHSMYDLNSDILVSLNDSAINNPDSFLNKNPRSFANVFSKSDSENVSSRDSDKESHGHVHGPDSVKTIDSSSPSSKSLSNVGSSSLSNNQVSNSREAAVLVFGYPETISNEVIKHFLEFGTILERFEVTKPKSVAQKYYQFHIDHLSSKPAVPVFTGDSWVKLTYDNPTSALSALLENGAVFNGVLLGVVPYSKNAVERLQRKRVENEQDIGGKLLEVPGLPVAKQDDAIVDQTSYSNRLDVKDGASMFLHAKKPAEETKSSKFGLLSTATKYLFGFNEL